MRFRGSLYAGPAAKRACRSRAAGPSQVLSNPLHLLSGGFSRIDRIHAQARSKAANASSAALAVRASHPAMSMPPFSGSSCRASG